jgi:hypothetical protein
MVGTTSRRMYERLTAMVVCGELPGARRKDRRERKFTPVLADFRTDF